MEVYEAFVARAIAKEETSQEKQAPVRVNTRQDQQTARRNILQADRLHTDGGPRERQVVEGHDEGHVVDTSRPRPADAVLLPCGRKEVGRPGGRQRLKKLDGEVPGAVLLITHRGLKAAP